MMNGLTDFTQHQSFKARHPLTVIKGELGTGSLILVQVERDDVHYRSDYDGHPDKAPVAPPWDDGGRGTLPRDDV